MATALRIGIHSSLAASAPEVKYVFRTLLGIAGYGRHFCWADGSAPLDIYYGPSEQAPSAELQIIACGRPFADAASAAPQGLSEAGGLAHITFDGSRPEVEQRSGSLRISGDIIFASYWLLSGAAERDATRDRFDNLDLSGSFLLQHNLLARPLVSEYAAWLREYFRGLGRLPLELPWQASGAQAAVAISHDVDYPQMIRSVEVLRLLRERGLRAWPSVRGVLSGANHFWKFREWVEWEKSLDARSAFYFSARRGSLLQYASGTPDCFYDVRAREFLELFKYLQDEGCEVGLHASYHAHRSAAQLRAERESLEAAAGAPVEGNRHHYWHLDPAAPHETLLRHEAAGFAYDSSLAFEFYPGWRRGICHPFHVFHPGERREIQTLQLPPAWMDDHFHRRLEKNKIADPAAYAAGLLAAARASSGIVVLDYHVRGMNSDFFPQYGSWLVDFMKRHADSSLRPATPAAVSRAWKAREIALEQHSADETVLAESSGNAVRISTPAGASNDGGREVGFLKEEETQDWESFVRQAPSATVYHTMAWKAVTQESLGHEPHYMRVRTGGRISGVLPLFLVRGMFGRRLVSMPLRDRGGVLATDATSAALLLERAKDLTRELDCKYLELRGLDGLAAEVVQQHGLVRENHWVTTRLDISAGCEAVWKGVDKKGGRWPVNDARKKGVQVEVTDDPSHLTTFHRLLARTRRSMGVPCYSGSFFESIGRHMFSTGLAKCVLARANGKTVGAAVIFLFGDTGIYAYAAPDSEAREFHPSDILVWEVIEHLAKSGFRCFDFGADSPQQTGLLRFKRKWGGVQRQMSYDYFLNRIAAPPRLDSSSERFRFVRGTWKALPVGISDVLGPWITRQLS